MKATVIINPAAGRGRALRLLPQVEKALKESGQDFTVRVSQSPEDPPRLAREAIADVALAGPLIILVALFIATRSLISAYSGKGTWKGRNLKIDRSR
jgi:hypothetical protein